MLHRGSADVGMKVGDMVRFSKTHREKPGLDYTEGWLGIIVEKALNSAGVLEELHILWKHGTVNDYPSSWWNKLPYEPFEVIYERG